jgi:hypothetical protein
MSVYDRVFKATVRAKERQAAEDGRFVVDYFFYKVALNPEDRKEFADEALKRFPNWHAVEAASCATFVADDTVPRGQAGVYLDGIARWKARWIAHVELRDAQAAM